MQNSFPHTGKFTELCYVFCHIISSGTNSCLLFELCVFHGLCVYYSHFNEQPPQVFQLELHCTFFQASSGNVSMELLDCILLRNDFLAIAPPKSTGREMYGVEFTKAVIDKSRELHLSPNDVLRTVTGIENWVVWVGNITWISSMEFCSHGNFIPPTIWCIKFL